MTCVEKNEGGCEYCPAGKYVQDDCNSTQQTKCIDCKLETYTDSSNYLRNCLPCSVCLSQHKLRTLSECTTSKNRVCECETGFFCSNDVCDHCQPLTKCPPGEGVKVKATRTTDTVCAKCEAGTYNNVTDYSSPCIAHNRCEEREFKTPGRTTHCRTSCSWILPAGLWAGLVMTILIVTFVFILWRARRKSHRTDNFRVPDTLEKIPLTPADTPPDLSHCQESCPIEGCKLPIFNPDNPTEDCSRKDSFDSSVTLTQIKVSFPFVDSDHINGSKGNFLRLHSEPQEDEWCGAESPGIDQVSSMA